MTKEIEQVQQWLKELELTALESAAELDAAAHECINAVPADLDRLRELAQGWMEQADRLREAVGS